MNFKELIPNICNGFPFKEGDYVLLNFWGDDKDKEIMDTFCEELSKKGITPYGNICSKAYFSKVVCNLISKDQKFNEKYGEFLSSFKHVVDVFMYKPSMPEGISEESIPKFREYLMSLFGAVSSNKEYYIQLTVPTEDNAKAEGIDFSTYQNAMYKALSIDFDSLKQSCKNTVAEIKGKSNIEIITGEEHRLTLRCDNREWNLDDGSGDLPAGEVYIATVEDSANGTLLVPTVFLQGKKYKDVIMSFESGKLVKCSNEDIEKFFESMPDEHRVLCEFGIGLNTNVTELIGYPLIDEKAIGTYHIALGMNHMFGGNNQCHFHMDFVFKANRVEFE